VRDHYLHCDLCEGCRPSVHHCKSPSVCHRLVIFSCIVTSSVYIVYCSIVVSFTYKMRASSTFRLHDSSKIVMVVLLYPLVIFVVL
jgi:hypothetical protein